MIRLSWIQFRVQALVALGLLAAVAVSLAITGPGLVHLYATTVAPCARVGNCESATRTFLAKDSLLQTLGVVLDVVPGLVGIFWGAPLIARELETGAFRLAWTQSVTRTRWLAAKLGLVGLASATAAGLLSLAVTWWSSPFDKATADRFSPGAFSERGLAPIGYAAFAFALGVAAGLLIRQTLPAMAATLVAFVVARVAVTQWLRPHLLAPSHLTLALDPASMGFGSTGSGPMTLQPATPALPNAWIYSIDIVDKAGHGLPAVLSALCPALDPATPGPPSGGTRAQVPADAQAAFQACVTRLNATYHEVVTYQPASRYWPFQWYETAVFLGFAALLVGFSFWWIRRRLV